MSQNFKVIFAALAVTGTLGAVQLASGHDLSGLRQLASTAPVSDVNRTGKTDRGALRTAQSQTETITIRNVGLEDTSVVVRVPVTEVARNRPAVPARPAASNKPSMEGEWTQLKGKIRDTWGRLTDDDVDIIAGKRDQLIGKIKEELHEMEEKLTTRLERADAP